MKTFHFAAKAGMTTFAFAVLFTGAANATCKVARPGYLQASHASRLALSAKQPMALARPADTTPTATTNPPTMTGYWYVRFFSEGQLVDDGFDIWTSDGTEVLNDTSAPSSGAVCLGVWAKSDTLTYDLKHPSWIFDDAGVNLIGITIIREHVQLDPGGNSFTGTLTVDVYDLAGNVLDHETGQLTGTRINAMDDTAAYPSPIPGLPASILNR